jgi:hypothetical protein
MIVHWRGIGNLNRTANKLGDRLGVGTATKNKIATTLRELKSMSANSENKLTQDKVNEYLTSIKDKVQDGTISEKTATDKISILNDILRALGKDDLKISASDNGLHKNILNSSTKAVSQETHQQFKEFLEKQYQQTQDIRYLSLSHAIDLQREAGLRLAESLKIKITEKDSNTLKLTDRDGTKNNQLREVKILHDAGKQAIESAKQFAIENGYKSLIPNNHSFKEMVNFAYNTKYQFERTTEQEYRFHGERHSFATEQLTRYQENGLTEEQARQELTEDLGHHRIDITYVYTSK